MKHLIATFAVLIATIAPATALAANHKYTCGEFAFDFGGHTCSSGVITFTGNGGMIDSTSAANPPGAGGSANFPLTNGTTYYIHVTSITGSNKMMQGSYYYTAGGNFGVENLLTLPGSASWSFVPVKPTGAGLYFQVDSGTWSPAYAGTFGPVCISNVSAADAQSLCDTGGGGGGGSFPYIKNAVQDFRYTYDNNGNLTGIDNQATSTTAAMTATYTYDKLNRLTQASTTMASSSPYYRSFAYDALGSITGVFNGTATTTYTYGGTGYANPHAVTSYGGNTYGYDNAGNLTSASSSTFTYDYANRLKTAVTNGTTTTNSYDHGVNRVTQVTGNTTTVYPSKYFSITSTKSGATTTATSTEYVYNGDTLIATIDQVMINGTATGSPITSFIYPDHLGSTNVVANSSGAVVQTLDYLPYGATRLNSGSEKEARQYIGQFADDKTSLSYLNARHYDAARGQFTSQDPVFWELGLSKDGKDALLNPQAMNSYAYANDNPIAGKDPDGRFCVLCAAAYALLSPNVAGDPQFNPNGTISNTPQQSTIAASVFIGGFISGSGPASAASKTNIVFDGVWSKGTEISRAANAVRHATDHAGDFGLANASDYVNAARGFVTNAINGKYPIKIGSNGMVRAYDATTNTFAAFRFNPNTGGTVISTFFKPSGGSSYFGNQSGQLVTGLQSLVAGLKNLITTLQR